jgi:O-antigen ligase
VIAQLVDRQELLARSGLAVVVTAAAALVGLSAVTSPALALAVALGLVFIAVAFRSLAAGVALFTVITFFDRIPGVDSAGLTGVKAAGAVLVASWFVTLLGERETTARVIQSHALLAYAAVVFVSLAFASALWAGDVHVAAASAFRLAQGVLLFAIVLTAVRTQRHLVWIVWAYMTGAFLTAVVGLAGGSSAEELDPYAASDRLAGRIGDPNELAAILVPALALVIFGFVVFREPLARWLLVAYGTVFALALFFTESRGGLVALAVLLVAIATLSGSLRARAVGAVLIVAALGIGYYSLVAPPETLSRVTEFAAGGGTGRLDLWGIALDMSADHPALGVGAGNFQIEEPAYATRSTTLLRPDLVVDTPKVAHNTYLHVLAEFGWIGLALLVGLIIGSLAHAWRAVKSFERAGRRELEMLARGVVVGTLGMLAAFAFISAQYEKQLWLLLGLAASLSTIARTADDEDAAASP